MPPSMSNADLRDTCGELAKQGYFALSPDLFWRPEPGVDLSDQTEAEWRLIMRIAVSSPNALGA